MWFFVVVVDEQSKRERDTVESCEDVEADLEIFLLILLFNYQISASELQQAACVKKKLPRVKPLKVIQYTLGPISLPNIRIVCVGYTL